MPTLEHLGVRYHWRSVGQGAAAGVFLHCSMASGKVWVPMMTHFCDQLTSQAIDMPGHGGTEAPNLDTDLQVQAAAATIKMIEQTGAPVHLVGHSYGATIALRIARERPDLLHSLVAIEPVFFSVLDDTGHVAFAPALQEEIETVAMIQSGDKLGAMKRFMTNWASPGDWDRLDAVAQATLAARVDFLLLVGDSILFRNSKRLQPDDFAAIKTPTLLMRGAKGRAVIGYVNDTLARLMPNAHAVSVAGAGHMLPLTHLEQVAPMLREHWQKSLLSDI